MSLRITLEVYANDRDGILIKGRRHWGGGGHSEISIRKSAEEARKMHYPRMFLLDESKSIINDCLVMGEEDEPRD